MNYFLEVQNLNKHFGATHALRDASLSIEPGEVVALLGENGAGKSTLTKIIAGEVRPDTGRIMIEGREVRFASTADAIAAGIARVPQELQIFPSLTVHENLYAGNMPEKTFLPLCPAISRSKSLAAAHELMHTFGITLPLHERCEELTFAQKQLVMLLRALTHDARILILDEPTAALEHKEVQLLFQVVLGVAAKGVAVIYITHRLAELRHISTRTILMRDGEIVQEVPSKQYDERQLGEILSGHMKTAARSPAPAVRKKTGTVPMSLFGDEIDVPLGEVSGYSGLLGSGVETLLLNAFRKASEHNHTAAGFISGERGTQAFYDLSILQNICAPHLGLFSSYGHFKVAAARKAVNALISAFDIRPADPDRLMRQLSGGNQQKVLLARWFVQRMDALLLVEPTAGVDVGAKQLIQRVVDEYRQQGGTVLLSSTDYEELISLCDQVTPVIKGRLGTPIKRGDGLNTEELRIALGASQ